MTATVDAVVIDLDAGPSHTADHYAIRHRPSGRFLAWDDTFTPDPGPALRFDSRWRADLRCGAIEQAGEYEVVGLRYVPRAG